MTLAFRTVCFVLLLKEEGDDEDDGGVMLLEDDRIEVNGRIPVSSSVAGSFVPAGVSIATWADLALRTT